MTIQHRVLEPDEGARAIAAGGPLAELQPDPERLKTMSIAVVEVDGVIVAYWVAWYGLHLEPLWVKPEWRQHPAVGRGLTDEMEQIVQATGEPAGFCVIHTEDLETIVPYARRLGFSEAPGKLYYLVVQAPVEPVGV